MRTGVVAVALLVVLAGCNAPLLPGGDGSTPTPSPASTPTATATTPGTTAPDPADAGLSASGVEDPLALTAAHEARLANTSYTLTGTTTVRAADGTVLVRNNRTVEVAAGGERFAWDGTSEVAPGTPAWLNRSFRRLPVERAFSDGNTTTAVVVDFDGERRVHQSSDRGTGGTNWVGRDFTGATLTRWAFLGVDTRVVDVERVDGTVRYHLAATDGPQNLTVSPRDDHPAELASLTAEVDRTGVVRALVIQYVVERDGERYGVTTTLTVTDVGETTVERPGWLEDLEESD